MTDPIKTEPVMTEPVMTEPVMTEPVMTEPVMTTAPEPTHRRRRRLRPVLGLAGFAGIAIIALVGCSQSVVGQGSPIVGGSANAGGSTSSTKTAPFGSATTTRPPSTGSSTGTSTPKTGSANPSGTSTAAASVKCPNIVDPDAGLSYTCIDNSLTDSTDLTSGPTVSLTVDTEVGWSAEQASGPVSGTSTDTLKTLAEGLVSHFVDENYGDNPTQASQTSVAITVSGHKAQRVETLVNIDPAYAKSIGVKVTQEKLTVVVVTMDDGSFSALEITVPDTKKDWWTRYDSVVSSLKVI
jgi:hypothetical protein